MSRVIHNANRARPRVVFMFVTYFFVFPFLSTTSENRSLHRSHGTHLFIAYFSDLFASMESRFTFELMRRELVIIFCFSFVIPLLA